MGKLRVTATKGIIGINSACVMRRSRNVVWISIDTRQKYPSPLAVSGDREIYVCAGKNTLHVVDRSLPPTRIELHGLDGNWRMFTEMGRYSIDLIFVREQPGLGDTPDILDDACRNNL